MSNIPIPAPFTQTLPENAPNRDMPDWVASRFDGYPDFRSDLSIAGLRVISRWPGNWAWCEDKELLAFIRGGGGSAAPSGQAAETIDFLTSKIEILEAESKAARDKLVFVHGEISKLVGEVGVGP